MKGFAAALLALACFSAARAESSAGLKHRYYLSPEEIRTEDTRTLAERLVARLHLECDEAHAPPSGEALLGTDFELIMMVPARMFDVIARTGFLNQHQTLTTNGFDRLPTRFATEQELAMLRLPYSEKGRELLPKYAVLNIKKSGLGVYRLPTQYGEVAVVFKGEVSRRATWTYADSLDFSQRTGRFGLGGAANPVLPRTVLYRRKEKDSNRCGNYCEAQVWGELSLKDADYAMIRDTEPVSAALAASGLRVYRYSMSESSAAVVAPGQTAQFVRGALIADGAVIGGKMAAAPAAPSKSSEFARSLRRVGELAADRKTSAVARALKESFSSTEPAVRSQALYGLSELPWKKFKPYVIDGLKDPDWQVQIEAIAFAAEHRDDRDVASALDALKADVRRRLDDPRDFHASEVQEWLGRLEKPRLCD